MPSVPELCRWRQESQKFQPLSTPLQEHSKLVLASWDLISKKNSYWMVNLKFTWRHWVINCVCGLCLEPNAWAFASNNTPFLLNNDFRGRGGRISYWISSTDEGSSWLQSQTAVYAKMQRWSFSPERCGPWRWWHAATKCLRSKDIFIKTLHGTASFFSVFHFLLFMFSLKVQTEYKRP